VVSTLVQGGKAEIFVAQPLDNRILGIGAAKDSSPHMFSIQDKHLHQAFPLNKGSLKCGSRARSSILTQLSNARDNTSSFSSTDSGCPYQFIVDC